MQARKKDDAKPIISCEAMGLDAELSINSPVLALLPDVTATANAGTITVFNWKTQRTLAELKEATIQDKKSVTECLLPVPHNPEEFISCLRTKKNVGIRSECDGFSIWNWPKQCRVGDFHEFNFCGKLAYNASLGIVAAEDPNQPWCIRVYNMATRKNQQIPICESRFLNPIAHWEFLSQDLLSVVTIENVIVLLKMTFADEQIHHEVLSREKMTVKAVENMGRIVKLTASPDPRFCVMETLFGSQNMLFLLDIENNRLKNPRLITRNLYLVTDAQFSPSGVLNFYDNDRQIHRFRPDTFTDEIMLDDIDVDRLSVVPGGLVTQSTSQKNPGFFCYMLEEEQTHLQQQTKKTSAYSASFLLFNSCLPMIPRPVAEIMSDYFGPQDMVNTFTT